MSTDSIITGEIEMKAYCVNINIRERYVNFIHNDHIRSFYLLSDEKLYRLTDAMNCLKIKHNVRLTINGAIINRTY
jgi:hypothetical protein